MRASSGRPEETKICSSLAFEKFLETSYQSLLNEPNGKRREMDAMWHGSAVIRANQRPNVLRNSALLL